MQTFNSFKTNIFRINNQNFERHAIDLFQFQSKYNKTYREYIKELGINPAEITHLVDIPFMPIQFFKHFEIKTRNFETQKVFESSGTTGFSGKHFIQDLDFYNKISQKIFNSFFEDINKSIIIGLLPSYLERGNSSLVFMVKHFIDKSNNRHSGFYLNDHETLIDKLKTLSKSKFNIYLFGVTFALLDLAKKVNFKMDNLVVLETGGMKGRGVELVREELHEKLRTAFKTNKIFSEYGMTELLSQAYLQQDGFFYTPPWMHILIREMQDPFSQAKNGKTGVVKIVDLANVHSCSFIETEDIGWSNGKGFKILGRLDNSDLRGCNLMLSLE